MRLYVVATPIGNLQDITFRALEILRSVDFILCEDTRRTIKLLNHFDIKKPLISYHRHSGAGKSHKVADLLLSGKNGALVSDSGTPGIADPGNKLIDELVQEFGRDIQIIPVPGPSAVIAIASVAGVNMDKFVFLGFPPQKKGRQTFFRGLVAYAEPIVLYESPHRILKTLKEIEAAMPSAWIVLGKELTKTYERVYRGRVSDVFKEVEQDGPRGEYTLIISNL